ncbi:MAG: PIN domain-containing protein [Chloroflexota bacterium]|nr:PIN domain-containing protein [Chloroflexota bacterium]
MQALLGWFERLLNQFEWNEVFVTDEIRAATVRAMTRHRLSSQDACHLACAEQEGVRDFASFDEAYRRVDDLILWNDLIHGSG